jgi:hypothetical protein
MDFDDVWNLVGAVVVLAVLVAVLSCFFAPKNVDYYYLSKGEDNGNRPFATCVQAHWTWHPDELSFCTNDYQQALDFVTKANAGLPKTK